MSLKDELAKSRKLSPQLRMTIARLDDATDPDQPLFSALLRGVPGPVTVAGADIREVAGGIHSARNITLNGLKNLVDDARITYVEGSRPMFPEAGNRPKPPSM